jgi:hypothetical protein
LCQANARATRTGAAAAGKVRGRAANSQDCKVGADVSVINNLNLILQVLPDISASRENQQSNICYTFLGKSSFSNNRLFFYNRQGGTKPMNGLKFARSVFIFEALAINAGVGLLCFFFPAAFLANFSPQPAPAPAVEIIRWYGVLLGVLAFMVLRAIPANDNRVLKPAIEALLFGDIAHLMASYLYFQVMPVWNVAFIFMIVMATFLASVRTYWLYQIAKQPKIRQQEKSTPSKKKK